MQIQLANHFFGSSFKETLYFLKVTCGDWQTGLKAGR